MFFLGEPMKRSAKYFDHNTTLNLEANRKLVNGD